MRHIMLGACLLAIAAGARAEDAAQEDAGISVELNSVKQLETSCELTFVTTNTHQEALEQVVFETVLFDTEGEVTQLTLFDFGSLPTGRPRVRQFVVPDTECSSVGSILINGVATCSAPGVDPLTCEAGLTVSSRTDIELTG